MRKISFLIVIALFLSMTANAQYKKPEEGNKINRSTNNLILGIINPKNFSMSQTFQVSMLSTSFGSVSVTSYINSMNYKVSEKLNVSADVKLQYAPYVSSSFGNSYSKMLQNDLNGLSLSRLSVDYKISENSSLKFEFRKLDDLYYYNHTGDYYYDRFYR
ncbi:MAG: hypothetical protein LWX07_11235 [Bacteroidetes bacterium]|nr:hypothetical protein [Bacteroidota bacterium]